MHLIDAGQQFIKSNPDGAGGGANNGIVEYSVIEYDTTSRDDYTNGVDVHAGANWIVRHNLFRNIGAPPGLLAGPAVLMWNHSRNTIVEGNTFLNCAARHLVRPDRRGRRTITPAASSATTSSTASSGQPGDVAIGVFDSPNTQVLNNTMLRLGGTYGSPIEYRFAAHRPAS